MSSAALMKRGFAFWLLLKEAALKVLQGSFYPETRSLLLQYVGMIWTQTQVTHNDYKHEHKGLESQLQFPAAMCGWCECTVKLKLRPLTHVALEQEKVVQS